MTLLYKKKYLVMEIEILEMATEAAKSNSQKLLRETSDLISSIIYRVDKNQGRLGHGQGPNKQFGLYPLLMGQ